MSELRAPPSPLGGVFVGPDVDEEITEEQALAAARVDIAGARIAMDMLIAGMREYADPPQSEEVEIASLCEWIGQTASYDMILLMAAVGLHGLKKAGLNA